MAILKLQSGSLCFFIVGLFTASALAEDVAVDCQAGWTVVNNKCYRSFQEVLPWDSADLVCRSYGSKMVQVKDFHENENIGKFAEDNGLREYWIGASRGVARRAVPPTDERALIWSDGTEVTVAVGHWQNDQPDIEVGQCVLATVEESGRVLWSFAPCEKKAGYLCQRPVAPQGSFHCQNGMFVRQGLTCDGEDDCGDGSDELDCNNQCSYYHKDEMNGTITSSNYPSDYANSKTCYWLIELPLGYNVRLEFMEFSTESQSDEVMVLAGGRTVSESRLIARLSGNLSTSLPTYTSNNNFLMVIFNTDGSNSDMGFTANFSAVKEEHFPSRKFLTATDTPQELISPLYPSYLGSQDYTWIIKAQQRTKIVTLEIVEVDLKERDKILIRDGDMVFHDLLAELTSAYDAMPKFVLTTGDNLYITMQTRGMETGRGFRFRYWQGCEVYLNGTSGEIHSPGFKSSGGQYGSYQTCTYDVAVPGGAPVTVKFNSMNIHTSDEIRVYEGGSLLLNVTGTSAPAPFAISSGSFRVVFESDAILTDEGFSLTYSIGCPDPQFNAQTLLTPPTSQFILDSSVVVSCATGYAFSSEAFQDPNIQNRFEPLSQVTLRCLEGGKWNLPILPECEPQYCGLAPAVDNAYVVNSTGVTYQGTVSYLCYPGFAMTGSDTIECTGTGDWTSPPSCQTSSCSSLPTTIPDGSLVIVSGDGSNFSSVVEYQCSPGYQIVGDCLLFCASDGNWSASVPSCEILQCYVPSIKNGMVERSGQMIDVGDSVNASCNAGYISNAQGGGSLSVECLPDRSLQGLDNFNCSYQDKCQAAPDYCDHTCHDSEFENRMCSCDDGYTLDADMRTCNNVNECAMHNGGCDHICNDTEGSYECSCDPGYILFAYDGIQNYTLAHNEDGLRPGDVRRFNHTCLPVLCPSPPSVTNGNMMVSQTSYYYGDFVDYTCEIGFELSGPSLLTCNQQGQWDRNPPQCNTALCPSDTTNGLENPATVTPTGAVQYGDSVTLTCDVPGKPIFNNTRYCVYYQDSYQLVGADCECGFIDCGQPEDVAGSNFTDFNSSETTFGSSFEFGCLNLYAVRGTSEANDTTVRCLATGQWDFGSLRCEGVTCPDPRIPPDGRQVNTTSYDEGDLVYFECERSGFSLSDPYPLLCELNNAGNGLQWNGSVPACVDTEPPTLTGCVAEISVPRYARASDVVTLPSATDNVVVNEYKVTNLLNNITWPSDDLLLDGIQIFDFKVSDHAGNTETCRTQTTEIDDVPPVIQCPGSIVQEFAVDGEVIDVNFTTDSLTVSDSGGYTTPVFTPSSIQFTASEGQLESTFPPFRAFDVMAEVEDNAGNRADCQFQVVFRPKACSPFTLREPLHGRKNCSALPNSAFQCDLTCEDGYVFYDNPNDSILSFTCTDGNSWSTDSIPACVYANETSQLASFQQVYRFTYIKSQNTTCSDLSVYETLMLTPLSSLQNSLSTTCFFPGTVFSGQLTVSDIQEQGEDQVLINITLTFDSQDPLVIAGCDPVVETYFESDTLPFLDPIRDTTLTPQTCAAVSTSGGAALVDKEFFCSAGKIIQYQREGNQAAVNVCVGCPEGTRTVDGGCELCPQGTFNPTASSDTCGDCPPNTSTFETGAVSNGECTATCAAGMYSATGLAPCEMCPLNTYGSNSTYCEPCPVDYITRKTGSTSPDECLPPCPVGTYSVRDGHDFNCTECPVNFYSDDTGKILCTECPNNERTLAAGSNSSSDCIRQTGCDSGQNPCQNNAVCDVFNHIVTCACPAGYSGRYCENVVDPCASSPCFFNGNCTTNGDSYNCSCPTGVTGDRCETVTPTCTEDYCQNGGACRNDINGRTCLCKPGFSGNVCQNTSDICQADSCQNGGTCVPLSIRFRCECPSGFSDPQCETNNDDCASNPCLNGGTCNDLLNNFNCSCPDGFSGPQCEVRGSLCAGFTCNQGACVEDYVANTYRCICEEGNYYGTVCQYEVQFDREVNGSATFAYNTTGESVSQCIAKCEELTCTELIYDTDSSTCLIASAGESLSLQPGSLIYYRRVCRKVQETYWTPWFDSSTPSNDLAGSDDEQVSRLNSYGLSVCGDSEAVMAECRVVGSHATSSETLITNCSPTEGLLCYNNNQTDQQCEDYEIRFKCLSSRVLSESACEDIDYCSSSPCVNGTCGESQTAATCSCNSGFTGSLCQHDIDECATDPCQNSVRCEDLFLDYNCVCMPGYEGKNCETNVDECLSNPCSTNGTARCEDLLNRYQCVCNSGYSGVHCEMEINECDSEPCLHGGQCSDELDGFSCSCTDGWTGPVCEDKVELCQSNTCDNGADCINLFNDFYCDCFPNTYGKTCNNAPSICANANPCLRGSPCNESQGSAQCQCASEYTGTGCQIKRDMCSSTNQMCENGATCRLSQNSFSCDCSDGYTGQYCEENIDDCQGNMCTPGSTCIDMVNQYFCRCPVGKSGENCLLDADRDFDMLFSNPKRSSMAALGYPLHLTGGGFSVTMWIQYLNKRDTGAFFTMYSVSDPNSLSNKEELIRLDETGLTVSLNQQREHLTPLTQDANYTLDGEWHYIALSWNQTTGSFYFFVDTVRVPLENYNTGQPLDLYVWLVLGCRYSMATGMCQEGQGFNGYISQVTLYNRELLFNEELTVIGNKNPTHVFPDAIMMWGEFLLYPGVSRTYPSWADKTCPRGFIDFDTCTTPAPGKTQVAVDPDSCPKDIVMHSSSRVTAVMWNDVRFTGQASQVISSVTSGQVFLWGKYPVVVQATNNDGNKALCIFDIYVQYNQCEKPADPENVNTVFCASFTDEDSRDYKQCSVVCNTNYTTVVPAPRVHTCGPAGSWDPPNRYLPYTLSPCGATSVPDRRLVVVIVYRVTSTECSTVKSTIEQLLVLVLQAQNSLWSNGLCAYSNCSDIQLNIECTLPPGSSRRRRQTTLTDLVVEITADARPAILTSTSDSSQTIAPGDLFRMLVLSDTVFDFSDRVAQATPDPNGLDVQVQLLCQAPLALSGDQCVECAPGSYYDSSSGSCALCPIGTYQPLSSQLSCQNCSAGTITETVVSTNNTQCKTICPEGQFFSYDAEDCVKCPQGFYQNTSGLFYCLPCPVDKTTREEGADSETICFNDCLPGKELAENGTCTPCKIGFYKPAGPTVCQQCPVGLVTNETGADDESDCNVADNQPGYYRLPSNESDFAACPTGTYQPEKWQYDCISCGGDRFFTLRDASTSQDDCIFFCPAGQQQVGNEERCEDCAVGYYRTGANRQSPCEQCPNNTRTETTGSISETNCTIYKCPAGFKPTVDQSSCEPCPRGFYQPLSEQTDCLPCGGNNDTRANGSVSLSQCESYCESGYEKLENGSCSPCPVGQFKDNTIDNFHICTSCSNNVTNGTGATSEAECTVVNCQAGYKISGSVCEACPQGTYQDQPYQSQCRDCPSQQSTRQNTSASSADCETYCEAGKEKNAVTGQCDVCERGYYKSNQDDVFMVCTMCPTDYVTNSTGSTSSADCNIRNCSAGEYISNDSCELCDLGTYQPERWQTSCLPCATDKNTQSKGAVSETECILSCPPGKENKPGSDECTPCEQGFHKDAEGATTCTPCEDGFVTRNNGSTNASDCNLRACEAGYFANSSASGECNPCTYGQYQPQKWQEQCLDCPTNTTTYQLGANTQDLCLSDCLPGEEYIMAAQVCRSCPKGYFNDDMDPARYTCEICPEEFITPSVGATSSQSCTVRNCTQAGQYLDSAQNTCQDCPIGQWQNQKWMTSCNQCTSGLTTRSTGSSDSSQCLPDCPSGQAVNQSGQCADCPVGSYRNRSATWECQQCPGGVTTQASGSASRQECSVSTCAVGSYFKESEERCSLCEQNTYQDSSGRFSCQPCPDGTQTAGTGATARTDCIDNCQVNNVCDANAECSGTSSGVTCTCNTGYSGNGTSCTHLCDEVGYCQNSVRCDRELFRCICKENYQGDRCDQRTDPAAAGLSDKDTIIAATISTLAFILLLILLIVCLCIRARRRSKAPFNDPDERVSIATRMSTRGYEDFGSGYPTKTPSLAAGQKTMLSMQAHQMFDNPTYTLNGSDPAVYQS